MSSLRRPPSEDRDSTHAEMKVACEVSEGTKAFPTLELAVLSSELSPCGLFGAQRIAAPPSTGETYHAAALAWMA